MATGVLVWWCALCLASVANIVLWSLAARSIARRARDMAPKLLSARRSQLWLSSVYVLVCAYRSVLPRADVQRIVLVDSWLSNIALGRTLATVAETCFAVQWALFVAELGRAADSRAVALIARVLVPVVLFAECVSWYAVLTTNFVGNALEQSSWTLCGALILAAVALSWSKVSEATQRVLGWVLSLAIPFVLFMSVVDVPMYFSRFFADQAAGAPYLSWHTGLRDAAERWVVTHSFEPWAREMAWMALYFSVGVWTSIALSQAPALRSGRAWRPQRSGLHGLRARGVRLGSIHHPDDPDGR